MRLLLSVGVLALTISSVLAADTAPVWPNPPEFNYIDKHVHAKLKQLNLPPSDLCTDAEFLRRASLDLCSALPEPREVTAFLADAAKDKRTKLIDILLQRVDFADSWTHQWLEELHVTRRTLGVKGAETYRLWLRTHVEKNTPFNQVVRELLTATGNNHTNGAAGYFIAAREPNELAETTARLFLGVRLHCARCHKHPNEKWNEDEFHQLAAFFPRVTLETTEGKKPDGRTPGAVIVTVAGNGELLHPRTQKPVVPRYFGSTEIVKDDGDRRAALADWLTARDNPFFARNIVNRVWSRLMSRGIVEPVDDFRPSNPPANPELLDALAQDFVAHDYDLKYLIRTIMLSRTYQLSSAGNAFNKEDTKYFSRLIPKLLPLELLLDVVSQATEVPDKFKDMPKGTRWIHLPAEEAPSPFPKRVLGAAECVRDRDDNAANTALVMHFLNGADIQAKMSSPDGRVGRFLAAKASDDEIMNELFLAILSRSPREVEVKTVKDHLSRGKDRRTACEDIQWALMNSKEFFYRR